MREAILYYALRYRGDWKRIARAIAAKEPWEASTVSTPYVTIVEDVYPKKLRRLQYAPWILFYEGDLSLCERSCIGVIGSRQASSAGIALCKEICHLLKPQHVVVSGLAKGIDAAAHESSLQRGTIAVIGCGLDVMYPQENKELYERIAQEHLLLSEYPKGTAPLAHHFPWRNRILAGFCDAIVVVEAKKRSGTMHTVNEALTLGLPIYCIPHAFYDAYGSGSNLLLAQGAQILVDRQDIQEI